MADDHFVIVGGGQAGLSAAAKLRELSNTVSISLLCDEFVLPYQRPPLSKKYLSGEMPLDRLLLRPQEWFEEQNIKVHVGAQVETVDRETKTLTLYNGSEFQYDKLLLTTGSRARHLPSEMGGALEGVHYLRSTADSDAIRPKLVAGKKLVVIGGGYIGLEVSAVAAQLGLDVTIVEMSDRILQRVAAPQTSDFYRELHAQHGVQILEGVGLSKLQQADGHVVAAELSDGRILKADIVLAGIGILPNLGLAETAGLIIENGISVDEFCQTSDEHIYAAGDCASFEFQGNRIRLESVPNAINQAEVATQNMLGQQQSYLATPWFWSDQYDVKLQIAGLNTGFTDTVVRAGKREGAQSIWYYKGDQLIALDAMNDAPSFMMARRILEAGKSVPKHVASDASTNLKDWA